jgi:tetratricopeptide (TPR) repeat protein
LLYQQAEDPERSEAEFRAALKADPENPDLYVDIAELLASRNKVAEALATIAEGEKSLADHPDLFVDLIERFSEEEAETAEEVARTRPEVFDKNARANVALGVIRLYAGRAKDALPLLTKAASLEPKNQEALLRIAEAYRSLRNFKAALAAADKAVGLDDENGESHYQRACALAMLGRKLEAIAALELATKLDEDLLFGIEEEDDLKPVARMPRFIKLLKAAK